MSHIEIKVIQTRHILSLAYAYTVSVPGFGCATGLSRAECIRARSKFIDHFTEQPGVESVHADGIPEENN